MIGKTLGKDDKTCDVPIGFTHKWYLTGAFKLLNMKNITVNRMAFHSPGKNDMAALKEVVHIPTTEDTTAADRLLYLKDCLDKNIIDKALFRALRDELTYGKVRHN